MDLGRAHFRAIDFEFAVEDLRGLNHGVFFGGSGHPSDHRIGVPVTSRPETHSLIVGKTRAGKGIKVVIPTLLRAHKTSVFCIDPKGENACVTARARAVHSDVHIMNPWGELNQPLSVGATGTVYEQHGFPAATYNPLDLLKADDPNCVSNAKAMSTAMCPVGESKEKFWAQSAADLITATLLWLTDQATNTSAPEKKTLKRAAQILSSGRKTFVGEYVTRMAASEAWDGAISQLVSPFLDMADQTFSGIMSHVSTAISFLADPQIAKATSSSSFSMADLTGAGRDRPMTLYLVVPWDRIETQKVWLRLMINAGLEPFRRKPPGGSKYRCLFLFEEFPALGRIEGIENEARAAASTGVDLCFITQGISDIRYVYGPATDGILNNCAYKWFAGVNDLQTAEYLSKTLGKHTIELQHSGESSGESTGSTATGWSTTTSAGESKSLSHAARDLLTPDEVMDLGEHNAILLNPDGRARYLWTIPYWRLQDIFEGWPKAFPEVYYDTNRTLPPTQAQVPAMTPPPPEWAVRKAPPQPPTPNPRKSNPAVYAPKQTPNPGIAPAAPTQAQQPTYSGSKNFDPRVYAPAETPQKAKPPELRKPDNAPRAKEEAQQETRSGSPNFDPSTYAPAEVREALRKNPPAPSRPKRKFPFLKKPPKH
jgi:type IV secretion system protein VirD4